MRLVVPNLLRRRDTSLRRGSNLPKEKEHLSAQRPLPLRRRNTSLRRGLYASLRG